MDDNIGIMLAQVSRLLRRQFDARAREIGVTRPQWQVLGVLAKNPGIHQGGLAEVLEVEPITAGRMIDRLQEAGLVERRPDPMDRRTWRLFLLPRGEELMEALKPLARQTIDTALDGLCGQEQEVLKAILARIHGNLSRRPDVVING